MEGDDVEGAWSQTEIDRLRQLADRELSSGAIAQALGRTASAVRKKASRLAIPIGLARRVTR